MGTNGCKRHDFKKGAFEGLTVYTAADGTTKQAAKRSCAKCGKVAAFDCNTGRKIAR